MIHEENTKEINTETEFGYVMKHLYKIKPTFISIFSLNTNLFEMLDQTLFLVFDLLHSKLYLQKPNTNSMKRTFGYRATMMWNLVP